MKVVFWPDAETDVADAMAWYDRQSDGLGRALLAELDSTLARIVTGVDRYPKVRGSVRRALVRRFPYALYFCEDKDRIVVLAVFHQRRSPNALRARQENPPLDQS